MEKDASLLFFCHLLLRFTYSDKFSIACSDFRRLLVLLQVNFILNICLWSVKCFVHVRSTSEAECCKKVKDSIHCFKTYPFKGNIFVPLEVQKHRAVQVVAIMVLDIEVLLWVVSTS